MADIRPKDDSGKENLECEYTHKPDYEIPYGTLPSEEWSCTHPPIDEHDGEELCIFHLPVDKKSESDVRERLTQCVNMEGKDNKRFIGAEIPSLDLVNQTINSEDNYPIDFRDTTIDGDVLLDGSSVNQKLLFTGAEIRGEISAEGTQFHEQFFARLTSIKEGVKFTDANFYNLANFRNASIGSPANFRGCDFYHDANFYGCEFNVEESDHNKPGGRPLLINFSESTFSNGANFNNVVFNDVPYFRRVSCDGVFLLNSIRLNGKEYTYASSDSDIYSEDGWRGNIVCRIRGGEFEELRLSYECSVDDPCVVSITDSEIQEGILAQPEERCVYLNISGTTLGDVALKNIDSAEKWKHLIIRNTDFNGFDFTDYHSSLEDLNFDIYAINNPTGFEWFSEYDIQTKEMTFLKARIGADTIRDYRASSEFHIHELDTRRVRLWREKRYTQYLAHLIWGESSQYGEKPARVMIVFVPLLVAAYLLANSQPVSGTVSTFFGFLLILLPPIFSALLVLSSSRYIGN